MIKLDKKLVNNFIRLTVRYYETGNEGYFPKLAEAEEVLIVGNATWREVGLLGSMALYTQRIGEETYDNIYRALEAFGIIVEDKEVE